MNVVKSWMSLPRQKQPSKEYKSYERLKIAIKDPLIIVKFTLFENIARHLNSFLVQFQTDEPMVPFLCQLLDDIMRSLASRVVLKDAMTKANTCLSLIKLDFKSTSVHKRPEDVDAGVAAKFELQELVKKKEVNDTQCLKFKKDTILLLPALCAHVAEKSPLRVALRDMSDVLYQIENASICERRFPSLLELLYIKDQITNSSAEDAKKEFTDFIRVVVNQNRDTFMQYDKPSDDGRLDEFY